MPVLGCWRGVGGGIPRIQCRVLEATISTGARRGSAPGRMKVRAYPLLGVLGARASRPLVASVMAAGHYFDVSNFIQDD